MDYDMFEFPLPMGGLGAESLEYLWDATRTGNQNREFFRPARTENQMIAFNT